MSKRAIQLIRVSTEGQAANDRAGLPAQREANRRTAERYGLEIVHTIEIVDVSGARVLASPQIHELFRLMASPDIHGVVAKEFSRLMRPENFADYAIMQEFVNTKTVLYLPDGPLDFSSDTGQLLAPIRAAVAGMERRQILARMNDAKEEMRRAGRHPGGSATLPFGVGYEGAGRKWYYTAEAEKIREAYRLVHKTALPYSQIAEELNLPRTSLRAILQNPIYTGWRVYDQKRDPGAVAYVSAPGGRQGYRRKMQRPVEDVIRVRVMDGLVSDQVFDSVQNILRARAARQWTARTKNAPKYLFNGFLRCGLCGKPLYSHTNTKACYYICKANGARARKRTPDSVCSNPYILAGKIEPKIEHLLTSRFQEKEFLDELAGNFLKEPAENKGPAPDALNVARQIGVLRDKRNRILESFYDGVIDRSQRDEQLRMVDADLRAYEALKGQQTPEPTGSTVEHLSALLSVFVQLRFLNRDDKRQLFRAAGAEIFVDGYTIKSVTLRTDSPNGVRQVRRANDSRYNDSPLPAAGA
jgi:DNA invertase Pin-like site-specific DNA recombinase